MSWTYPNGQRHRKRYVKRKTRGRRRPSMHWKPGTRPKPRPEVSARDVGERLTVMYPCRECGTPMETNGRRLYCSAKCKNVAYRRAAKERREGSDRR